MEKQLKAYEVHDGDEGFVVVFATNGATARRKGAEELVGDFESMEYCVRRPGFDKYAPGPVPPLALIENGWWFECFHCGRKVSDDLRDDVFLEGLDPEMFSPTYDGQHVFCSESCSQSEFLQSRMIESAKSNLIEVAESKFPGCAVRYAYSSKGRLEPSHSGRSVSCYVEFDFPGGSRTAKWNFGDDSVFVAKNDAEIFKKLYRNSK